MPRLADAEQDDLAVLLHRGQQLRHGPVERPIQTISRRSQRLPLNLEHKTRTLQRGQSSWRSEGSQ